MLSDTEVSNDAQAAAVQACLESEKANYTLINAGILCTEVDAYTKQKKIKPKKKRAQLNKKTKKQCKAHGQWGKWCKQPVHSVVSRKLGQSTPVAAGLVQSAYLVSIESRTKPSAGMC